MFVLINTFFVCKTRSGITWAPVQPGALSQAMAESTDYGNVKTYK